MKNIYMVQPNSQYGNSVYFPYAAGSLVAYAFKDERIKAEFSFKGFIYKKENIDAAIERFENPAFVGFSCYVWNYEYNKAFAKKLKEKYPDCITVFGGHQVNSRSDAVTGDFADYVMLGEGEENFKNLLLFLCGKGDINSVANLYYKNGASVEHTNDLCVQIPERVSPYLEGYFDSLVEDEALEFSAIIETNRGCPNRCAFCDWGNIKSRVRQFDSATVFAEIDWMSDKKIEYCYCADANMGLFPRDIDVVSYIIKKHNETGYPQKFQATYSKKNVDTVFEINKRLNDSGMSKGATLSFQSMHQDVLNNINRKNMPIERFHELMNLYNVNKIPAYSELILGMPGETYESFKEGIEQLLECGQHMAINIFNCELLKNSIMSAPDYVSQYQIGSARTEQHQYHVIPNADDIKEYSDIVVSTSSMTKDMWVDSNIFGIFIRAFHNLGFTQCLAIYLYYEKGVKYKDFYCGIIDWAKANKGSLLGSIYYWLESKYREVLQNSGSLTCTIEGFGKLTWPLDEGAFLKAVKHYDKTFDEIKQIISPYFDDGELFEELLGYQRAIVKNPYSDSGEITLGYDFYKFFSDIFKNEFSPLEKRNNTLFIDVSDVPHDLGDYAEKIIWYGRKGGQNIVSKISYTE